MSLEKYKQSWFSTASSSLLPIDFHDSLTLISLPSPRCGNKVFPLLDWYLCKARDTSLLCDFTHKLSRRTYWFKSNRAKWRQQSKPKLELHSSFQLVTLVTLATPTDSNNWSTVTIDTCDLDRRVIKASAFNLVYLTWFFEVNFNRIFPELKLRETTNKQF